MNGGASNFLGRRLLNPVGDKASAIRIVIVDDHAVVRQGLQMFLKADRDLRTVGEAADGAEAVRLARELEPDVVLMDLLMPVIDKLGATKTIRLGLHEEELAGTRFDYERAWMALCELRVRPSKEGTSACRSRRVENKQAN
jgi:PleD family two-component response regulator